MSEELLSPGQAFFLQCNWVPTPPAMCCEASPSPPNSGRQTRSSRDQAAISWRASGNRQISLNVSAERAFANFRDKKHRILQLQIFATKT